MHFMKPYELHEASARCIKPPAPRMKLIQLHKVDMKGFSILERAAAHARKGIIFPTVHPETRALVLRTEREMPGAGQTRDKVK